MNKRQFPRPLLKDGYGNILNSDCDSPRKRVYHSLKREGLFEQCGEYLAGFADIKFFLFRCVLGATAECSIEEPAQMAALEFPGGALFPLGALFFFPARCQTGIPATLIYEEEEKLSFYMRWYRTPALLIAVDGLERHTQKFRQLFLGLTKFFSR